MNSSPVSDGEYHGYTDAYAADDAIPPTLEAVMRIMFADWLPGLVADANSFNAWSADKAAGTVVSHDGNGTIHPHVGKVAFDEEVENAVTITVLMRLKKSIGFIRDKNAIESE